MTTVVNTVVRPDGSVHPDLVPPDGMIALAWAVNVRPETMAEIAGLTARARTLAPAVEQLAAAALTAVDEIEEQFAVQDLTGDLMAHAVGAVGLDSLIDALERLRDVLGGVVEHSDGLGLGHFAEPEA